MYKHVLCMLVAGVSLTAATVIHTGEQSYAVTGYLKCGNEPAANVEVQLIDVDTSIDPDDTMGKNKTDARGYFYVFGTETETTRIDPVLKIYHDCDDGYRPCQRRWKFELPNDYIYKAKKGTPKVLNFGTWNLEMRMPDEEHDCVH